MEWIYPCVAHMYMHRLFSSRVSVLYMYLNGIALKMEGYVDSISIMILTFHNKRQYTNKGRPCVSGTPFHFPKYVLIKGSSVEKSTR